MRIKRSSGVLCHVTSLPSPFGIGDLGPSARRFVDFLKRSGQKYWQVLPLNPTHSQYGNSPYSSPSAFAGNMILISPEILRDEGLLTFQEVNSCKTARIKVADYNFAYAKKRQILAKAYARFLNNKKNINAFDGFVDENKDWLEDYSLFMVLKEHFGARPWYQWPYPIRTRRPQTIKALRQRFHLQLSRIQWVQFEFYRQWHALKEYANRMGVRIIGDVPIYVSDDSADVWTHPKLFKLDKSMAPEFVAGVPPDYFSKTGQRWGNPVFDWKELRRSRYRWWIRRLTHNFKMYDIVRVDHFRGFAAYWQVSAKEKTAVKGRWVPVPGVDFFKEVTARIPKLPIIAEDIGYITPDVKELMKRFGFPGMKILQFGFGGDPRQNDYYPSNIPKHCAVYSGTHDNNTTRGWFQSEASQEVKRNLTEYFSKRVALKDISWRMTEAALSSKAVLSIIPVQDLLNLGSEARMNTPGIAKGNWAWRLPAQYAVSHLERKLLNLTRKTRR